MLTNWFNVIIIISCIMKWNLISLILDKYRKSTGLFVKQYYQGRSRCNVWRNVDLCKFTFWNAVTEFKYFLLYLYICLFILKNTIGSNYGIPYHPASADGVDGLIQVFSWSKFAFAIIFFLPIKFQTFNHHWMGRNFINFID